MPYYPPPGSFLPLAGGTMTGPINVASGTITARQQILTVTQTWNNAAVEFGPLIFMNVVATAQSGNGYFMQLQRAAADRFTVDYLGNVIVSNNINLGNQLYESTNGSFQLNQTGIKCHPSKVIGFGVTNASGTPDTALGKTSAGVMEVNNGNIGTFRDLKARDFFSNNGYLMRSFAAITDGAGASAGTLTNAPAVGNPTKWLKVDDNGTTRYVPAW